MDFIVSYLKEKNYEILSTGISINEEGADLQNIESNTSLEGFSKQFIGLSLNTNQKVTIKISKSERIAYEMVKYEHSILLKMIHFNSVVHLLESFDLESENLFILITEYYDQSMDNYIKQLGEAKQTLNIQQVANLFDNIFYSLNQLHCRGITHNHINPCSIAIDKEGTFRFHSFISSTHLDHYYEYCKNDPNAKDLLIYKAPDYESNQINFKEESNIRKLIIAQSEDIYSLGVVLLQLIGVQVNESVLEEILTKDYLELTHLVVPELFNVFAVIKSFLLLKEERQRRFSVLIVRKQFYSCYLKHVDKKEINFTQINFDQYEKHNLPLDYYYFFLKISLIKTPNEKQINELISQYEDLPQSERESLSKVYFYQDISELFSSIGKKQQCLEYMQISMDLRKSIVNGENHELIACTFRTMGLKYYYQNIFDKALHCFSQATDISKKLYGSIHINISSSLADIADCHNKLNNRQTAIKNNLKAIEIANKVFIGDHSFKIDMLFSMGVLYRLENQHEQSLNMNLEVLKIKESVYRADSLTVAVALRQVGISYSNLKLYDQAIEYHKKSLKIKQQVYEGGIHSHIANSLDNLGFCYFMKRDFATGYFYSYRNHEMNLKLDKNNFENGNFTVLLGCIEETENPLIRLEFYLRFFRLLITNLNKDNPLIKQFLIRLADEFSQVEDYEAEEQFEIMKIFLTNQD